MATQSDVRVESRALSATGVDLPPQARGAADGVDGRRADATRSAAVSSPGGTGGDETGWQRRSLFAIGGAVAATSALVALWYARYMVLLMFGGFLLAVFLEAATTWVHARTHLKRGWSLTAVILGIVVVIGGASWLRGPEIVSEAEQLQQQLPQTTRALVAEVGRYEWARQAATRVGDIGQWIDAGVVSRLTGAVSSAAALVAGAFIIVFTGCYVAAEPAVYLNGLVRLVPPGHRPRARAIVLECVHTLRWWLVAKLVSMIVVGVLVTSGLFALGIPLAWTLGTLAGLLTFIPNIGPILSVVPPLLLALATSPERALAVALLFWGVHGLEGFFVTPLAERRAVKLPPVLTIATQVLFGTAVGALGVALAAPLAAVVLVLVRTVYVEGVLGDGIGGAVRDSGFPALGQ